MIIVEANVPDWAGNITDHAGKNLNYLMFGVNSILKGFLNNLGLLTCNTQAADSYLI